MVGWDIVNWYFWHILTGNNEHTAAGVHSNIPRTCGWNLLSPWPSHHRTAVFVDGQMKWGVTWECCRDTQLDWSKLRAPKIKDPNQCTCWLQFGISKKTKPDHSSSLAKATHIHSPDSLSVVAVVPECQHDRQVLPCSTPPKEAFVPRSFFRFVPHCWVGGARIYLPGLWRGTLHKNRAPLVQRNHF